MKPVIKVANNQIKFSVEQLGTEDMLVWVGHGFDPLDNDDIRVAETREHMKKYFPHIPYGMSVGNKKEDGSMEPIRDSDNDGYYDLDVSWWPEGVYRLNFHSIPGVQAPNGSQLDKTRDHDVSWSAFWESWDETTRKATKPFIHKEKNGAGYGYRILIRPDRTIEPFGDTDLDLK